MTAAPLKATRLTCITVTYNPSLHELDRQLRALPVSAEKIIVDNASLNAEALERLLQGITGSHLIPLLENIGLAGGINRGLEFAAQSGDDSMLILLLDQDSVPQPGSVETLIEALKALEAQQQNVGCVGPMLLDRSTNLQHGFHQSSRFLWRRTFPRDRLDPIRCMNLNGSGTLSRRALFQQLGGLEESFFIDHVDTEWAFRVQAAGYSLWGIPSARFEHSMGVMGRRYWFFGWRVWPLRQPYRHALLFRNAMRLMARGYVPRVWKLWALAKLGSTVLITIVIGPERLAQVRAMAGGIRAGLTG